MAKSLVDADLMKLAFDDVKTHNKALLDVVLAADRQAMSLLGFYISIAAGATAGLIASLAPTSTIPKAAVISLIAMAIFTVLGAVACLVTMKRARLNMPGREAAFWKWAVDPDVSREHAFDAYFASAEETRVQLTKTNRFMAKGLSTARWCGIVAPASSLFVGAIAIYLRL